MSAGQEFSWTGSDGGTLRTGISGAFWCDPHGPEFVEVPASEDGGGQLSWFDELLHGGIYIPHCRDGARALTMLVTGPPGTGKSTFVTELCWRWSQSSPNFRANYVSTEAHAPWLIDNAQSLFGKEVVDKFGPGRQIEISEVHGEDLERETAGRVDIGKFFEKVIKLTDGAGLRGWVERNGPASMIEKDEPAHVVVVDSLNVIPDEPEIRQAFRVQLSNLLTHGPRLIIFVLDSFAGNPEHSAKFWEYYCDIIIRMDRTYPSTPNESYMLRTIEIVKARYQQHAWGPHQLKIYAHKPEPERKETSKERRDRMMREHPFRKEGGIFIYPSVHYMLSKHKREHPSSVQWDTPPVLGLQEMLKGTGFPRERCTAFIGMRGGHKSHLGFMHVLSRVLEHDECGLIVSLRDDVGISAKAMEEIIEAWVAEGKIQAWDEKRRPNCAFGSASQPSRGMFARQPLADKLEIMYFPPGNITPEEFLHRIRMSIMRLQRVKGSARRVTLLFNSLDQLGPRFPLCAREPVFIAALLQMLSALGVTSIFIAVSEQAGAVGNHHGLESIAELILDFQRREQPDVGTDRIDTTSEVTGSAGRLGSNRTKSKVVVQVVRHAGGQAAGASGVLELIDRRQRSVQSGIIPGLHCYPLT